MELEAIVGYCRDHLYIRHDLDIIITECCLKHDGALGWCYDIHEGEIDIELDMNQSIESKALTLCHEMVHAWQFSQDRESCEDEAKKLEEVLYNGYLHTANR